jgi:DNA repair protein RadC
MGAMNPSQRIHDLPVTERPRERLAERGAKALGVPELLAILLRTGLQGASAVQVGQALMQQFTSLEMLARAPLEELQKVRGVGRDKAVTLKAAFELASRLSHESRTESPPLDNPAAVAALLRDDLQSFDTERLMVVLLNTRRRLIRVEEVSRGLLDTVLIHAREVFRPAILANAHSVILAHNHPGGDPSPSDADIRVTRDLIRAGHLLRIELLDHIILGRRSQTRTQDFASLRELGHFYD